MADIPLLSYFYSDPSAWSIQYLIPLTVAKIPERPEHYPLEQTKQTSSILNLQVN